MVSELIYQISEIVQTSVQIFIVSREFAGFLLSLRSHGSRSHRGPLCIGVLWITLFLLAGVWLRTSMLKANSWQWAAVFFALYCLYAFSLIPAGKAIIVDRGNTEEEVSNYQNCIPDLLYDLIYEPDQSLAATGIAGQHVLSLSRQHQWFHIGPCSR